MFGASQRRLAPRAVERQPVELGVRAFRGVPSARSIGGVVADDRRRRRPLATPPAPSPPCRVSLAASSPSGLSMRPAAAVASSFENVRPVPPMMSSWPSLPVIVSSLALPSRWSSRALPWICVVAALAVRHVDAVVAVDRVAAGGAVRQRREVRRRGDVALAHDPPDDVERIRAVQVVEDPLAALERTLDHGVVAGERVAAAVAEDRVAAVLAAVDAAGGILRLDAGHHAVDPPGAAACVVSAGIAVDDVAREGRARRRRTCRPGRARCRVPLALPSSRSWSLPPEMPSLPPWP